MDTSRWNSGDKFTVLDLTATLRFKTVASLSFDLGVPGNSELLEEAERPSCPDFDQLSLPLDSFHVIVGWLDVLHPCEGGSRLQLRVGLPDRFVSWESMRDIVRDVIAALQLPTDEPYHIYLTGLSKQTCTEYPPTAFGMGPWEQENR